MKSEERHRLHESELVHYGRIAQSWLERHGMKLAIGLAAVLLIAGGIIMFSRSSHARSAGLWQPLVTVTNPQDYADVATEYEGTIVGHWAELRSSQIALQEAGRMASSDREGAVQELQTARNGFSSLVGSNDELPTPLSEQALFGYAQTKEMLAAIAVEDDEAPEGQSRSAAAAEAYEKFVQRFPESPLAEIAKERAEALKTAEADEFYAWYREQNPNPDDLNKPKDATPGSPVKPPPFTPDSDLGVDDLNKFIKQNTNSGDTATEETNPFTPDSSPDDNGKPEDKPESDAQPSGDGTAPK